MTFRLASPLVDARLQELTQNLALPVMWLCELKSSMHENTLEYDVFQFILTRLSDSSSIRSGQISWKSCAAFEQPQDKQFTFQ
jgi:hypothetical protein